MASVKVAVRVRPLNKREINMESKFIIDMEGKKTRVTNLKIPEKAKEGEAGRQAERVKEFLFDHSYWTVNSAETKYASQEQIFSDLGKDVLTSAYSGYNACVFAYGQTGSGKTYTMMGNPDDKGLIPRICEGLFARMVDGNTTYRTEVSYLEIYNEHVRDLLRGNRSQHKLRVREHPKEGPYVQDLSKHLVMNYDDIEELMSKGNHQRTTAATNMNDVSSRSHAIFTIVFTQARFSKDSPIEMHSKIHLVDLAGSERADATGATGQRLKEGGSINKSLVTLGNVISTLADMSEKEGSGKFIFIPYRDSVLTWLLKDSLGGNSKTIMIATISPADCNYAEILSTLRYASRAKNIVNKPTVNEDPNVRLIRELRAEIQRLRALLGGNIDNITSPKVQEKLHENEARIKVLTEEWAQKWKEAANILKEQKTLALRKEGLGVVLDSDLPHLIGLDDDILRTGIMLYHLKEGRTTIGTKEAEKQQDIVLSGMELEPEHCVIEHANNEVTLQPVGDATCLVNGSVATQSVKLTQGAVILLGRTNMFRFNHPAQAAKLREDFKSSNMNLSRTSLLSQSMTDIAKSTENLSLSMSGFDFDEKHREEMEKLEEKRQQIEELEEQHRQAEALRLGEQQQWEKELGEKRHLLERLTVEAKERKQQAEQAQKQIMEERDRLKRRSIDIEKQFLDYLEEKEKFQEERENERFLLQQQKEKLESDEKKVKSQESDTYKQIEEAVKSTQTVIADTQKALINVDGQRENLESLKSDFEILHKLNGDTDQNFLIQMNKTQEDIVDRKQKIQVKEKELFSRYKNEKDSVTSRYKMTLESVKESREHMEADEIILEEAENQYTSTLQSGMGADLEEQLMREKVAIDSEKERLLSEKEKMSNMEAESERVYKSEMQTVEMKRCGDIDELNAEKEKLKQSLNERISTIDNEIMKKKSEHDALVKQLQESNDKLADLKTELTKTKQLEDLPEVREDLSTEGQPAVSSANDDSTAARAEDCLIENQSSTASVRRESFRKGKKSSDGTDSNSDGEVELDDLIQERNQLNSRIEELKILKKQLSEGEHELESKRRKFEDEREQELDKIDFEKFRLQEMEHEERINALVEQEVKRRLFEERVQREKQRRIERQREKHERQEELLRIKKSHDREIQRLKEKYEGSNLQPNGGPTKANPYASLLTGDVAIGDIRNRSRSQRSSSHSSSGSGSSDNPIRVLIPSFTLRGYGIDGHFEFEVKISVGGEQWTVFRRYSRFRDLHNDLKARYPEVAALDFPPKRWFSNRSEKVAIERRKLLECYVQNMLDVVMRNKYCPLSRTNVTVYNKQLLFQFHQFFKKGIFEATKHGTG